MAPRRPKPHPLERRARESHQIAQRGSRAGADVVDLAAGQARGFLDEALYGAGNVVDVWKTGPRR